MRSTLRAACGYWGLTPFPAGSPLVFLTTASAIGYHESWETRRGCDFFRRAASYRRRVSPRLARIAAVLLLSALEMRTDGRPVDFFTPSQRLAYGALAFPLLRLLLLSLRAIHGDSVRMSRMWQAFEHQEPNWPVGAGSALAVRPSFASHFVTRKRRVPSMSNQNPPPLLLGPCSSLAGSCPGRTGCIFVSPA